MFSSDQIHIFAEPGMLYSLEELEASQDTDGVWCKGQPIGATLLSLVAGRTEGTHPKLSLTQAQHPHSRAIIQL